MQVGGSYLGMMCGGGVFLMLSAASGWPVAMLIMALLIMVLSLPLWRITEPTRTVTVPHVPALGYALRRRQARLGLLLVLMLNSRYAVCAASSGAAVVGSWAEYVSAGCAV